MARKIRTHKGGAPLGNDNAKRGKEFRDALRKKIAEEGMEPVVDSLYDLAAEDKDLGAIREIADRVDGKVPQSVVGEDDGPVQVIIKRGHNDRS